LLCVIGAGAISIGSMVTMAIIERATRKHPEIFVRPVAPQAPQAVRDVVAGSHAAVAAADVAKAAPAVEDGAKLVADATKVAGHI
jgi:hypothetical protein